ncbi:peptidase T [Marinitoga sp. 1135]|uniref:Peptidase T n=1 Tax=Marinitoga piezophila (strain DSM 14283 / JCM 11233 / KA3) TaxID=443254 RepID=H2J5D9_MARPK|nr:MULTISPECIES: peptidase T [Marinitoga]AEX86083.1 peptidase T [Marinitoga piezophila KA3]APT76502.1 peptidase T [Marinitoga sp. 1137]NUU96269.1 peptidase T [Marinitoga sp. 1135]NUU98188.1 peptidase T [Marinitoga sp. 1138]
MKKVQERFLEYVKFYTTSDENSETCPSTPEQLVFANYLKKELEEIGLSEVEVDENGYVYATLPANSEEDIPVIGFIAHMDTAPALTGKGVKPKIIKYEGGDIVLNEEKNIVLSPEEFPKLNNYIGQEIIVTDGNTLLGADDKAGIAEIITAMEYLIQHPEIKHGKIRIGFTPDEEIGRGADRFNVEKFGAKFAYTIDGGEIGELEAENFNAATAHFKINGKSIHPGTAKNKMINAAEIAAELIMMFPQAQTPQNTEKYEGFFHVVGIKGDCDSAEVVMIVRDHDKKLFENKKWLCEKNAELLNKKYGGNTVELNLKDSYYNMKEIIDKNPEIIEIAKKAMENVGVTPIIKAIRGGTDGARLSYMGLPCPNIFTGGHNFHGRYEYIPIPSMEKAVEVIIEISKLVARN